MDMKRVRWGGTWPTSVQIFRGVTKHLAKQLPGGKSRLSSCPPPRRGQRLDAKLHPKDETSLIHRQKHAICVLFYAQRRVAAAPGRHLHQYEPVQGTQSTSVQIILLQHPSLTYFNGHYSKSEHSSQGGVRCFVGGVL